jgi:hypothetical protein
VQKRYQLHRTLAAKEVLQTAVSQPGLQLRQDHRHCIATVAMRVVMPVTMLWPKMGCASPQRQCSFGQAKGYIATASLHSIGPAAQGRQLPALNSWF